VTGPAVAERNSSAADQALYLIELKRVR
jgi:hypothetical protein